MTDATLRAEDVLPVQSRISWGAIVAGAVVSLAVYFLLTLLGGALGLSMRDTVRPDNLATGAAIWAVVTTVLCLFVGGYVASQLAVGESRSEAVIYGVTLWGLLFAMLVWLMASGVQAGFNAMIGMSDAVRTATTAGVNWEDAARQAGVPQAQIDDWRRQAANAPAEARQAANNPDTRQAVAENATKATWWALLGTVLSMLAAVGGAVLGSGPNYRLVALPSRMSVSRSIVVQS